MGQRLMLSLTGREKVSTSLSSLSADPIHEIEWEDWSAEGEHITLGFKQGYCVDTSRRLSTALDSARQAESGNDSCLKVIEDSFFLKLSRLNMATLKCH
jgi:hypothetical protein